MTLENIIEKYGTHELDVSCCISNGTTSTVYAYCHQHNIDDSFMVNHYLKITGAFVALRTDVDDESDIYIHIACIEKSPDGTYEISGVGGYVQFITKGELIVTELSEEEYNEQTK